MQTVDFFTPVVDDPYMFGQIAAANALSDVYAVGGRPLTALNLICFPAEKCSLDAMERILRGGFDKVREAGAVIVGGHSVDDPEPKYGLAVTGLVDPQKMITSEGAKPGDRLVLTKPLGTGIITTALKGEALSACDAADTVKGMASLNADASAAAVEAGASAVTDITGFGLAGHLNELLIASGLSAELDYSRIPYYPGTLEMASRGMIPGGAYRNLEYFGSAVTWQGDPEEKEDRLILLADPQTSGGLLMAVRPDRLQRLLDDLARRGAAGFVIGETVAGTPGRITIF